MGASGWSYFTEYHGDADEALQELRQRVFERGEYAGPWDAGDDYAPADIETLLEDCSEDGTHSILDIMRAVDTPSASGDPHSFDLQNFCKAFPLEDEQLDEIFGTTRPSHEQVSDKQADLMELRPRWEASYVVVYEDGEPREIFFTGFSGD